MLYNGFPGVFCSEVNLTNVPFGISEYTVRACHHQPQWVV